MPNNKYDIEYIDCEGYTNLMRCAESSNKIVGLKDAIILLDNGADINYTMDDSEYPQNGVSALILAVHYNNKELVELLLAKGANTSHKVATDIEENGKYITIFETAKMRAIRLNHQSIIPLFL